MKNLEINFYLKSNLPEIHQKSFLKTCNPLSIKECKFAKKNNL